jgi:hypothetical protein
MVRNSDVVLAPFRRGQSQVAAGLPCDGIPHTASRSSRTK